MENPAFRKGHAQWFRFKGIFGIYSYISLNFVFVLISIKENRTKL